MLFDAHRDPTNYILGDIHYAQHSCSLQMPHVLKRVFPWNNLPPPIETLQHIEKYHLIPNISHILRYFSSSPTFDTEKKIRTLCYSHDSRFQMHPRWFLLQTTICFHHPHPTSIVPVTREAALLLLEPPWSENIPTLRPTHFSMKRLNALQ